MTVIDSKLNDKLCKNYNLTHLGDIEQLVGIMARTKQAALRKVLHFHNN